METTLRRLMNRSRPIEILMAKAGLDGHDRGVKVVSALLREKQREDIVLIMGGVIPAEDIPVLKEMGVAEVFITGSSSIAIIDFIKNNVR